MRRALLLLCIVALAAGCGGGERRSTPPPRLPGSLARAWARQADTVAAAAASGDGCLAGRRAVSLERDVTDRRASVPARYRTTLLRAVERLAGAITCTVTTAVTVPSQPAGHGSKPPHQPPAHGSKPPHQPPAHGSKPPHQPPPHGPKPPHQPSGHGPGGKK